MSKLSLIALITAVVACVTGPLASAQAVPVELVETDDGYQLLRGGEPYFIRGGGGANHLELLAASGGNSFRTWGHEELEPRRWPDGRVASVLDIAHELGLTVCAGFWVRHPRHGFDYSDEEAVEQQIEDAVEFVNKWKHHPAILMWGVGNEVALDGNHAPVFKEIDRIAAAVKKADPSRPTMSALAGIWPNQGELFESLCPNVDILGLNAYGGLPHAAHEMVSQGYTGPFVVTEFGPVGHWELATTPWGAPIEQPTAGKVRSYRESYRNAIANRPYTCLGSYAFLWGHKQEVTSTWYGMFLPTGEKLEPVDLMAELWSGNPPANRCPHVDGIETEAALRRIAPDTVWTARVLATEPDGDPMTYRWRVTEESTDRRYGGDAEEVPPDVPGMIISSGPEARFRAPMKPGAYRLFVEVHDGKNAAGAANIPFYVAEDGAHPAGR
ncbi:MAG: glycoside hydrolase family 2 TIM barrel-domain containing protein [Planctomycetota bacterium]